MSLSSYDPRPRLARMVWDTPVGPLGLVRRNGRLARIHFHADPVSFPFEVERTYGSAGEGRAEPFDDVRRQLEEYFAGRRLVFRLPLDLDQGTPFQRRVWKGLLSIPYGQTLSYRDLARTIGQPSASRAVGAANGKNPLPIVVPCHRVVAADGSIGGFSGGLDTKKKLLGLEAETCKRIAQLGMFTQDSFRERPWR
jgi:methylated-DNA-[protein]-cysteine S-methyltransferase